MLPVEAALGMGESAERIARTLVNAQWVAGRVKITFDINSPT
jgi:hypothetical protein